jgi:two-component system LytT family response regulator/two-component system response regulator LytT
MKCIIIDDEKPARDEIEFLLEEYATVEIIAEAQNGIEGIELFKKHHPEIVFIDIQMPKINGLRVAERILAIDEKTKIVFVTAFDEYAIQAFRINAIDYLLKPVSVARFKETMTRVFEQYDANKVFEFIDSTIEEDKFEMRKVCFEKDEKYFSIDVKKIIYADIQNKQTQVYTRDEIYNYSGSLNELQEKLNKREKIFFRSHRGYIININYVEVVNPWFNNTYRVKLKHIDDYIPVARTKVKEFNEILSI